PGGSARARSATRITNSPGVRASRSCTQPRRKPPGRKCTWLSMKPGATNAPCASTTRAEVPASFRTSALDPTAASRSPRTARPSAHGRDGSPVQTRALTTASDTGGDTAPAWGIVISVELWGCYTAPAASAAALHGVPDVEQYLEIQLLAPVGEVQRGHLLVVAGRLRAFEGLTIHVVQVGQYAIATA